MKQHKKTPMIYKRGKLEISGDPKDIKAAVWLDLIISRLWLLIIIAMYLLAPKASILSIIWRSIKFKLPYLIHSAVPEDLLLVLSG